MRRGPTLRTLQRQCDAWNARIKVGDLVEYRSVIGLSPPLLYKTRSEASVLSGHTPVVWLEGKSGCVCIDHCAAKEQ